MFKFYALLILVFFYPFSYSYSLEQNYYEILGVSQNASQKEIERAYKKLALKYHPDHNKSPDATEKMIEINNIYEILKDIKKRDKYDRYLKGEEGFSRQESFNEKESFYDFSEAFKSFEESFDKKPFDQEAKQSQQQEQSKPGQSPYLTYKTFQLFKMIMINMLHFKEGVINQTDLKTINKQKKLTETALKELLKEVGILNLNETSQKRILNDFYQSFSTEKIKEMLSNKNGLKITQTTFVDFIEDVKEWYEVQNITNQERRAIEIFHRFSFLQQSRMEFLAEKDRHSELLRKKRGKKLTSTERRELNSFEQQARADLRIFKKMLSALGLPGEIYNDITLRSYLDGLKEALTQNLPDRKNLLTDHSGSRKQRSHTYIRDADVIRVFKNIKVFFDETYYKNLKTMSLPYGKSFLKNFPAQFLIFQAAIGASIYRQAKTDPYLYGAEKNPEMLSNTMRQTLTPSGALSFFIFIAVSQQVHQRLYGMGRLVDGKSFKTPFGKMSFNGKLGRGFAPGAGLGIGFFVSSVFDELIRDVDLQQCAKQLISRSQKENLSQYIDPCEAFYLNWGSSEKWKHYAVDIGTLIGSGTLSHRFVRLALRSIRSTKLGSSLLLRGAKRIGPKISGWIGFGVNIYFFMEFHKILDEWIGQPLKEHLTAASTKNNILKFTDYLENDLADLSLYGHVVADSNQNQYSFKEKISDAEKQIKRIGHKFQHWTNVKAQHYMQSAHLWAKKLNKLLLPYEGSSKFLKDIFLLSHFNYGLEVNSNHVRSWDSDKEINNEEKDWNAFNSPIYTDNEIVYLIYKYLTDFSGNLNEETEENLNFMSFLGRDFNEMFSSDPYYSVKKLSRKEKFQLSKTLIEKALYDNNILSHFLPDEISKLKEAYCSHLFPNYETDEEQAELYSFCYNSAQKSAEIKNFCSSSFPDYNTDEEQTENYNGCLSFFDPTEVLKQKIRIKFLSAGMYLLKELLNKFYYNPSAYSYAYTNKKIKNHLAYAHDIYAPLKDSVLPLIEFLEVHKKGEKYFLNPEQYLKNVKKQIRSEEFKELSYQFSLSSNPYLFTKNLVCGGNTDEDSDDFVVPQFFSNSEIFIYDFPSNQFVNMKSVCEQFTSPSKMPEMEKQSFHDVLFHRPVRSYGKAHENLYLAIEDILKENYSSSKELAEDFQKLSQKQLNRIGDRLIHQLEAVTENYYKNMINFESAIHYNSSLQDFAFYYHKDKILLDIRSFTGGLKGLEIPLFQVNYWMNILKESLALGDQNNLNQETFYDWQGFDESSFEKMQFEVLSLLQSYHDSYTRKQGPYLLIPDKEFVEELNEIFKREGKEKLAELYGEESRFVILKKEYRNSALPVLMESDTILSHILASSIPSWNNLALINFLNENMITRDEKNWEKLIHSTLVELRKSLFSFSSQLHALKMKESFENDLPFLDNQLSSSDNH